MKRLMVVFAAAAWLLSCPASASADTMTLLFNGAYYGKYGIIDQLQFDGKASVSAAGGFDIDLLNADGVLFETLAFCVELEQYISGQSPPPLYAMRDLQKMLDVKPGIFQAAWLFNEYAAVANTFEKSAALQMAIWKAVYGDRLIYEKVKNTEIWTAYQTYSSNVPAAFTPEMQLELESLFDVAHHGEYQDLIAFRPKSVDDNDPVPEPGTILLFGAGVLALAAFRKIQALS